MLIDFILAIEDMKIDTDHAGDHGEIQVNIHGEGENRAEDHGDGEDRAEDQVLPVLAVGKIQKILIG